MLGNICQVSLRLERECLLRGFFPLKFQYYKEYLSGMDFYLKLSFKGIVRW